MASKRHWHGDGSIEVLPGGSFRAVISNGKKPNGKRDKRQKTFRLRRDAKAWLRQQLVERDRGRLTYDDGLTLGEWLCRWVAYKKSRVEHGSWVGIESVVRLYILPRIGTLRLGHLTPSMLVSFFAGLERDKVGRCRQGQVGKWLRSGLKAAVKQGLLPSNPMDGVDLPRYTPPEMKYWSAAQVGKFVKVCDGHRLEALFLLALDTGMRQGELLALTWDDVDLGAGAVRVTHSLEQAAKEIRRKAVKTRSSRRRIKLSSAGLAALRRHRQKAGRRVNLNDPVFCNNTGGWLWASNIRGDFHNLCRKAGSYIRFHDLRHTHATLSLTSGASIRAVSARLGHKNTSMTLDIYAHVMPEHDSAITDLWAKLLGDQPVDRACEEE